MNKKFSFQDLLTSLTVPHPARDWFIILVLFIALFFALVAYAGYLFWGIRVGTIVGSADVTKPVLPSVSRSDLTKAVETFRTRKANYEARNFAHPTLVNPAK